MRHMTSPTGPDQNNPQGQPGYGAPQQPPAGYNPQGYGPAGYEPAPGYGPAPAYSGGPAATGQRPGMVTAAAVIGIVLGALGLLSLFAIGVVFEFNALLGLLTLLSIATAAVLLLGGIQTIQGKSPRLLLLGSYASIVIQLLTLIWSVVSDYGFAFTGLLGFVLPGLIVFLLMRPEAKQYYSSRGIQY
jgi:hypothetical protein